MSSNLRLSYLDLRGDPAEMEWSDEIHPVPFDLRKVAVRFDDKIREVVR